MLVKYYYIVSYFFPSMERGILQALTRQVQILQAVEKHMFVKKRSTAAVLPYYCNINDKQYAV